MGRSLLRLHVWFIKQTDQCDPGGRFTQLSHVEPPVAGTGVSVVPSSWIVASCYVRSVLVPSSKARSSVRSVLVPSSDARSP